MIFYCETAQLVLDSLLQCNAQTHHTQRHAHTRVREYVHSCMLCVVGKCTYDGHGTCQFIRALQPYPLHGLEYQSISDVYYLSFPHKYNQKMFPKNNNVRGKDVFEVNFARTSQYLNSAIPQCQRLLNTKFTKEEQHKSQLFILL